jgi:hypothetical protein
MPDQQRFRANFSLSFDAPVAVDGFQALVNRWVKTFMTPKGSDPINKSRGTEYPYLVGANVPDMAYIQAAIVDCVADATAQVQAVDRANLTLPAVSRLRDAQVTRFNELAPGFIEFWVEITNYASQRLGVLIPYKVL